MFLIILSLIFGLGLRLVSINQSLWLDEAISVQTALNYSVPEILTQFAPKDVHPPLYYIILNLWLKIFPLSEFYIRLPSIIFGLLTAVFVYKIYKLAFEDKKGAFLSMLLLLLSPLHLYYSQEARNYSLASFLVAGSFYYFIKLLKKGGLKNTALYTVFSVLMLYSHYLCWFILFSQFVYFLFYKKYVDKKTAISYTVALLFNLFFFVPWLPIMFQQLSIGQKVAGTNQVWSQLSSFSFKNIALLPVKFIIGRISFENKGLYFLLMFVLILFFSYFIWHAYHQDKRNKKIIFIWLFLPPILTILLSFWIPIFSYFRLLFCLPAFYILVVLGVSQFKSYLKIISFVIILNLYFSFRYLGNQLYHREDWKGAVRNLHNKNQNQAHVLIIETVTAPFEYYDKKQSKLVYFKNKELVSNDDEVWLIPYSQPIFDPDDSIRSFLKNKGFQRTYEKHFRGVTLERWQKLMAIKYN